MILLGIETSCDETSAAVISGDRVLSNIISSQVVHAQFGGVVPELASRAHVRLVVPIAEQAIENAGIKIDQLEGLAVTHGPGLVGALLVGVNFIKGLAAALNIPFIGVNHIEGHLYGNILSQDNVEFPIVFLIVSGGHTQIVLMEDHLRYKILGKTRDDAVGEAFDKGAKLMGLGYPGGPAIDKLSRDGDPEFHKFPRAMMGKPGYDFSYSGLKTALLVYLNQIDNDFKEKHINDICASYQRAAVEVLVRKTIDAAKDCKARHVGIAGGVAANSLLRGWLQEACADNDLILYLPRLEFCTDNAAMIARTGLEYLKRNEQSGYDLNAYPALKLKTID